MMQENRPASLAIAMSKRDYTHVQVLLPEIKMLLSELSRHTAFRHPRFTFT